MLVHDDIDGLLAELEAYLRGSESQQVVFDRSSELLNVAQRVVFAYTAGCPVDDGIAAVMQRLQRTDQAELDQALRSLHKAEEVFRLLDDAEGLGIVQGNKGVIHGVVGSFHASLEHHAHALGIFAAAGNVPLMNRCIANIGVIQVAMEPHERMMELLFEAVQLLPYERLARTTRMREDLVAVFSSLADCVEAMQAFSPAFGTFSRRL